jgi:hypothetical protein
MTFWSFVLELRMVQSARRVPCSTDHLGTPKI